MKKDEKHIIARTVWSQRVYLGISAKELAARCGWSQRTFDRRMENPEEMTLKEEWKLEAALGLKKGELVAKEKFERLAEYEKTGFEPEEILENMKGYTETLAIIIMQIEKALGLQKGELAGL